MGCNLQPVVDLKLGIGQVGTLHGGNDSILCGDDLVIADGIGTLAGYIIGIAVGGDSGAGIDRSSRFFGSFAAAGESCQKSQAQKQGDESAIHIDSSFG